MSARSDTLIGRLTATWPQTAALVVGAVYALVGIIGFAITGFDDFAAHTGESLLGFEINPLHNLVHLAVGIAGVALARTLSGARTYGGLLAVAFGAAFVYGLFAVNASWDFLALNWSDNILHLVSTLIGLGIAIGPVHVAAPGRATRA